MANNSAREKVKQRMIAALNLSRECLEDSDCRVTLPVAEMNGHVAILAVAIFNIGNPFTVREWDGWMHEEE